MRTINASISAKHKCVHKAEPSSANYPRPEEWTKSNGGLPYHHFAPKRKNPRPSSSSAYTHYANLWWKSTLHECRFQASGHVEGASRPSIGRFFESVIAPVSQHFPAVSFNEEWHFPEGLRLKVAECGAPRRASPFLPFGGQAYRILSNGHGRSNVTDSFWLLFLWSAYVNPDRKN